MRSYLLAIFLLLTAAVNATTYYVDASTTSSTQNGSAANPWKTLSQVSSNQSSFQPGDFILFKRGGVYTGTFNPTRGGTASAPLTFGAYGTGAKPQFTGTGSRIQHLFYVQDKDYIIFRDLWITDPSIDNSNRSFDSKIQRAFTFDQQATNCKIISCDISLVGVAAYWVGGSNTMDSCDVGNLRMVVDSDDGSQPGNDDDYGANPLVISSADNIVTHNNFHDCWSTSFDYDYDGGAIEFYGDGVDNNFIAYNTMSDNVGICEVNGNSSNNTWAYNKMVNNGSLFYFQSGSTYTNNKFYNNVVIENVAPRVPESRMIGGALGSSALVLKNNIFHLSTGTDVASSGSGFVHEDNIYKVSNNSQIGFTIGSSELATSVALFVNTTAPSALSWNFTPVSGSPAIDFGQNVGLTKDFAGNNVPAIPNSGILESGGTAPTNPLAAASTATVISCHGGSATVTVTASGGTAPYTGTGTFTHNAGTFNFTITDATGASTNTSITIVEPAALSASVVAGTAPTSTGTAAATITASGGTPTYTYSLDGGSYQSSNTFPSVSVGVHDVVIRDGRACSITKRFTVAAASAPLTVTAVSGTVNCNGDSTTVTVAASGGEAPYSGVGTFTVPAGVYTYSVTDANGTVDSIVVTIVEPAAITGLVTVTGGVGVSTATISASGGTAPYEYQMGNGAFQAINNFDSLNLGTYSFTIRDSRGCVGTVSATVSQPLVISGVAGTITCHGGTATVTMSASGGLEPYSGIGTFTVSAGTHTYTVTDANGTSGTYTVTVTEPAALNASVSAPTISVIGGLSVATVSVTGGTAPYTYQLGNAAFQASNTFDSLSAGSYTFNIMDKVGCVTSATVTIAEPTTQNAFEVRLLSKRDVSCTDAMNGSIFVSASGGTAPYTYKINNGSYRIIGIFFWLTAGTYDVTAKDATGATSTITVIIENSTTPCFGGRPGAEEAAAEAAAETKTSATAGKTQAAPVATGSVKLKVFPNPTTTEWNVVFENADLNEPALITLTNISGQVVYSSRTRINQKLTLGNNLHAGIYILKVVQGNKVTTDKIVKAK